MHATLHELQLRYPPHDRTAQAARPQTWGQHSVWEGITKFGADSHLLNVAGAWPVPSGADLPAVFVAISALVTRHATLRTFFAPGPIQTISYPLALPVEIVDLADAPETDLALLVADRRRSPFDFARDLPCRFTVVVNRHAPVHVIAVVSHLAVDSQGMRLLRSDFHDLLGPGPRAAERAWQPFDQAEQEGNSRTRAMSTRACGRWIKEIGIAGEPLWGVSRSSTDGFVNVRMRSERMSRAAAAVATAHATSQTTVLMATCIAVIAARIKHEGHVAVEVVSANRHLARAAHYAGPLSQTGIVAPHCSVSTTFGELIGDVADRTPRTFLSAYWAPDELAGALDAAGLPSDHHRSTSFMFNDTRPRPPRAAERPTGSPAATIIERLPAWRYQPSHCSIMFGADGDALTASMRVDARYFEASAAAATLYGFEVALELAACGDGALRVGDLPARIDSAFDAFANS